MKHVKKGSVTGGIRQVLLEESTLYTMQYIISARVEKLYTFSVSDSVLRQLLAIMKSYRAVYLDHSFQTLKMLEGLFTG